MALRSIGPSADAPPLGQIGLRRLEHLHGHVIGPVGEDLLEVLVEDLLIALISGGDESPSRAWLKRLFFLPVTAKASAFVTDPFADAGQPALSALG